MSKSLFENLYAATETIKKAMLKPTKRRELERQFQAHYDRLAESAEEAAEAIVSQYTKIGDDCSPDINSIVRNRIKIADAIENQKIVANEYRILFAEEIKGVSVSELIDRIFNSDGSLKIEQ